MCTQCVNGDCHFTRICWAFISDSLNSDDGGGWLVGWQFVCESTSVISRSLLMLIECQIAFSTVNTTISLPTDVDIDVEVDNVMNFDLNTPPHTHTHTFFMSIYLKLLLYIRKYINIY